jgi:erythromycin esterase
MLGWARQSHVPWDDLAALGRMIGDARVVALGEGAHLAAEPLDFRNRLFQYLVQERGFTAIAIESGLVESRVVHDYVQGGPGELQEVMADGFSWTFDRLPQNEALVRWLRQYNAAGHARKINFYGFDVPGSPGHPSVRRGPETALVEVLKYLERVDASHARGAIEDLITLLERNEGPYIARSSATEFEWAYRAALGARQTGNWFRQLPVTWQAGQSVRFPSEEATAMSIATDVRDRAQADNIDWILAREGPDARVLVYASRYHVSTAPVSRTWSDHKQQVAGTYLRRRLGTQLVTIGNLIGRGSVGDRTLPQAPPNSIEGLLGEVGAPRFLLDLRSAPADVASWLEQEHQLGQGEGAMRVRLRSAFDILLYIASVSPSRREA